MTPADEQQRSDLRESIAKACREANTSFCGAGYDSDWYTLADVMLDALGLERVHPSHDEWESQGADIYWGCAAHSEGQECCADAADVYRLTAIDVPAEEMGG